MEVLGPHPLTFRYDFYEFRLLDDSSIASSERRAQAERLVPALLAIFAPLSLESSPMPPLTSLRVQLGVVEVYISSAPDSKYEAVVDTELGEYVFHSREEYAASVVGAGGRVTSPVFELLTARGATVSALETWMTGDASAFLALAEHYVPRLLALKQQHGRIMATASLEPLSNAFFINTGCEFAAPAPEAPTLMPSSLEVNTKAHQLLPLSDVAPPESVFFTLPGGCLTLARSELGTLADSAVRALRMGDSVCPREASALAASSYLRGEAEGDLRAFAANMMALPSSLRPIRMTFAGRLSTTVRCAGGAAGGALLCVDGEVYGFESVYEIRCLAHLAEYKASPTGRELAALSGAACIGPIRARAALRPVTFMSGVCCGFAAQWREPPTLQSIEKRKSAIAA